MLESHSRASTLQIGFIVAGRQTPAAGSERYFWDLLEALPPTGIDVHGLVVGDPAITQASNAAVESFAPEGGPAVARVKALRRAVSRNIGRNQIVVSHHAQHALPVLDVVRSRPLVVHCHGPLVREGRGEGMSVKELMMRSIAERFVYARAERIIVLSRAFGDILQHDYHVPAAKIRVVPGGVDLTRFQADVTKTDARRRLGWPTDRPMFFTARRLAPTKGLDRLIDAMPEIISDAPSTMLVIAGSGPLTAQLEQQVQELGLGECVRFAGYVDENTLRLMYRAADALIVPTVALEGFGLVVVEALACGTPALVTPVSGLPEVVRDLDPRLVLAGSEPVDIARGIIAVASGEQQLPDAAACRAYAQRFDWRKIATRVGEVYHEVA
jgi:glycogen(starch) synthase